MGILFENCDLLLRGEDGGYSTLHGFLGVRGDTIDYIGAEKPTGEYEEHKSMEHKLLMPGLINCHNHSPMVLLRNRRLDAVRARLLQQPSPCVTDAALEFGFGHLGRFSSYYRERFGEAP